VVVAELNAFFLAGFSGFVKEFGGTFPAARLGALLFVNPGTDDIAVADDFGGLERFVPMFFYEVVGHMARRRGQTVLVEGGANILWRMIEITGEFDFFVAGSRDLGNRAFYVRFHGVADGVELKADAVNCMCDRRAAG